MAEASNWGTEEHDAAVLASTNAPLRRRRKERPNGKAGTMKKSPSNLHAYQDLPDYLQDNEFIFTGYRYNLPVKDTIRSLFDIHNETGNVWSHLLGFVLFLGLTLWIMRSPPTPVAFTATQIDQLWHSVLGNVQQLGGSVGGKVQHLGYALNENLHQLQDSLQESVLNLQDSVQHGAHALSTKLHHNLAHLQEGAAHVMHSVHADSLLDTIFSGVLHWPTPRWPAYIFCAGAMTCLLLSSICHLFGCCQKHVALFIWRLDYAGIAILIVSSFYPPVYYGFMCVRKWAVGYLGVSTVLGVCAVAVSLMERFQRPELRPFRAAMFAGLGTFGIIPMLHMCALQCSVWHVRTAMLYDGAMGAFYLGGAMIYALRVPERWLPGKFDLWLNSHQIFHVAVVAGAYMHWLAVLLLLEWRDASGGCAAPLFDGPAASASANMRLLGQDVMHFDQVWAQLRAYAAEHLVALPGHTHAPGEGGFAHATACTAPGTDTCLV